VNEASGREHWHLERGVSISHILTTVTLVAGVIASYYNMSARVSIIEERVISLLENQVRIDTAQDEGLSVFRSEMRDETNEINSKLDMVLERLISR